MSSFPTMVFKKSILLACGLLSGVALLLFSSLYVMKSNAHPVLKLIDRRSGSMGFWGIVVRDLNDGSVVFELNARKLFVPASNQKLITTASALVNRGQDYRFVTRLVFQGERAGDTLNGDLTIQGAGDPTFASRKIEAENPLADWAQQLRDTGVRRISGRVIGDDNVVEDWSEDSDWHVSYAVRYAYTPVHSGLTYFDNQVGVELFRESGENLASLRQHPVGALSLNSSVSAVSAGKRSISILRKLDSDLVRLEGILGPEDTTEVLVPMSDPTKIFLQEFSRELELAGVEVDAQLLDIDELAGFHDQAGASVLAQHRSPPLAEIVRIINKTSNNLYADQLFQTLSRDGSSKDSSQVTARALAELDVRAKNTIVRDGSGISRQNLSSPRAMVDLLLSMRAHKDGRVFTASLPRAGEVGTTLEDRLENFPVKAKTGSLANVRALSGFANGRSGREYAFSIMANNFSGSPYNVEVTIDEIVNWIIEQ